MDTRTLILRRAGFVVDEAFNVKTAMALVNSDSIDALVMCHTLSKRDQKQLISGARKLRKLLPIIYVAGAKYESSPQGCIKALSDPTELLETVNFAVQISPHRKFCA